MLVALAAATVMHSHRGWETLGDAEPTRPARAALIAALGAPLTAALEHAEHAVVDMGAAPVAGLRASHGTKKVHRHPGGTGQGTDPGRTLKGTRLAGQYGNIKVTTRNLEVVGIDPENNLLLIKGAVPGPNGGMLVISETNFVG